MLENYLATQIISPYAVCKDEAEYLIKQLETANLALKRFLGGAIDFADYCDILQLCDVGIDDYLINVEQNLSGYGLI